MAYQERLDSAHQVLTEHNDAIGKGNPGFVDPDEFIDCIKVSGGTNEDRLKRFRYEELLECMPEGKVKPVVLAKQIAGIFRAGGEKETTKPISAKRASAMQPAELVEVYDAEDPKSPIGKRLKDLSRGQAFIVFDGQQIDVKATTKLLLEVKAGHDGRDRYKVGDKFVPVYKVGQAPPNMVDENPFYIGRALRPDGTCDQTSRSWDGVDIKVRQLVRLILIHSPISSDTEGVNNLLDKIMEYRDEAFAKLSDRYPKASEEFGKLDESGGLPTLRVPLKKESGSGSPFSGGKEVICG